MIKSVLARDVDWPGLPDCLDNLSGCIRFIKNKRLYLSWLLDFHLPAQMQILGLRLFSLLQTKATMEKSNLSQIKANVINYVLIAHLILVLLRQFFRLNHVIFQLDHALAFYRHAYHQA